MGLYQIGKGKLQLQMLDSNGKGYTENLGYSKRDLWQETDTSVYNSMHSGMLAVADLMNGTYINNKVTYEFNVEANT